MKNRRINALDKVEIINLYKAFIDMPLFEDDQAKEEILLMVEDELRAFATSRLEVLLGDREDNGQIVVESQALPFTEDEIAALKMMAQQSLSILGRTVPSQDNTVYGPPPAAPGNFPVESPAPRTRRKSSKAKKKTQPQTVAPDQLLSDEEIATIQKNPKRYQRVLPGHKPAPMPPQELIDTMHAQQVTNKQVSSGFGLSDNEGAAPGLPSLVGRFQS